MCTRFLLFLTMLVSLLVLLPVWPKNIPTGDGVHLNATVAKPAGQTNPLAFTHVTVIDAIGQPPLSDRTVIVQGERIQSIGKFSETRVPKSARIIDATGEYMIPGLWDMHVHFRGGPALIPDNEAWLSIFLANGITGVREMGGDIAETVFQWRAEVANGRAWAPEFSVPDLKWTVRNRSGPARFRSPTSN